MNIVVIGATGEVGQGITGELIARGHRVLAIARTLPRLEALAAGLGRPAALSILPGSLASDEDAVRIVADATAALGRIDGVALAVNAARERGPLLARSSADFARLIGADLVTHFTAIRAFLPHIAPGGALVGIGGGSCDFILGDGGYMSVAQAGLRNLYRALGFEHEGAAVQVRELIVASVVNSHVTRHAADPLWVTDREIGAQVAAMLERPADFPGSVWRISRRDASGRPPVTVEPAVPYAPLPEVSTPLAVAG